MDGQWTCHHADNHSWRSLRRLVCDEGAKAPALDKNGRPQVNAIFGKDARKLVSISRLIDNYNMHMGGVDIADQLRQYYTVQMRSRRTWIPLFLWLVDTSIVNAYIMRCMATG